MMSKDKIGADGAARFVKKWTARILPILLSLLLLGCATIDEDHSLPDGILIIPGTSPTAWSTVGTDTDHFTQTTEAMSGSEEDTVDTTYETAEVPEADTANMDAYAEQAQALLHSETFSSLLLQAGGDPNAALPYITALLCYMDLLGDGTPLPGDGEEAAALVYWTAGGSVWHEEKGCSALAKSKNILSGSVDDARHAGKSRGCKRCTGEG